MKDFTNRAAVVTGAASGIGRAMSKSFLQAGMKVVLADIDAQRLEDSLHSMEKFDVNPMGVVNGIHAFMPIMLDQNIEAHVVNTALWKSTRN